MCSITGLSLSSLMVLYRPFFPLKSWVIDPVAVTFESAVLIILLLIFKVCKKKLGTHQLIFHCLGEETCTDEPYPFHFFFLFLLNHDFCFSVFASVSHN